jgi:hypothetical protein
VDAKEVAGEVGGAAFPPLLFMLFIVGLTVGYPRVGGTTG